MMRGARHEIQEVRFGVGSAVGFGLLGAPVASATVGQCDSGYACLWGQDSYSGCFVQVYDDTRVLGNWTESCSTGVSARNGANSVRNEFNTCDAYFFSSTYFGGNHIRFDRLIDGYNYTDPDLGNGGGVGTTQYNNWEDTIESVRCGTS